MLESLMVEAGNFTGAMTSVTVADREARKILEEAAEIAAQRMSKQFPELPEMSSEVMEGHKSQTSNTP